MNKKCTCLIILLCIPLLEFQQIIYGQKSSASGKVTYKKHLHLSWELPW